MSSLMKIAEDNSVTKPTSLFTNTSNFFEDDSIEEFMVDSRNTNYEDLLNEENLRNTSAGSGEICIKYIPLSTSSILRHPYFNYPCVKDPGIQAALLRPEPLIGYSDDGQELYLAICKKTNVSPVRKFYRELLEEEVNLKYYGISQIGFRPIFMSLQYNNYVKILDLTDNWISEDGCFHLGEMLTENNTIKKLNLYGCRIGAEGARRLFANLHFNQTLCEIDLTKNCLGDEGVHYLGKAIFLGSSINNISLGYNALTAKAVTNLAEVFETHNKLTRLDISWNTIISPNAIFSLCSKLSENKVFEELNLSWTSISGLRVGKAIRSLLNNSSIKYLNLSNNKLSNVAIKQIANGLAINRGLNILDLSYNPLTSKDALNLLSCLKERKVKIQKLLLENVFVTTEFIELYQEIMSLTYRKNVVIKWGGLIEKFKPTVGDMREIVLNRIDAICKKSKKHVDIAQTILEIYNLNKEPMGIKEFARALKSRSVILDEGLLDEIYNSFVGPAKTINLASLIDYLKRKWPDRLLPPTSDTDAEVKSKEIRK